MKMTEKHLAIFKAECEFWLRLFGVDHYRIAFALADKDCRAEYSVDASNCVATIYLAEDWKEDVVPYCEEDLLASAKHEATVFWACAGIPSLWCCDLQPCAEDDLS